MSIVKKDPVQMYGIMYHTALNNFYVENNIREFEYPTTLFAVMTQILTDKEQAISTVAALNSNKKVLNQMKKSYGLKKQIEEIDKIKKKTNQNKSNNKDELNNQNQNNLIHAKKEDSKEQVVQIDLEDGETIFLTLQKHIVESVSSFDPLNPDEFSDIDEEE